MALAADPVEDHAQDLDAGFEGGESLEHGGGRSRLGAGVDDQNYRPPGGPGKIGGGATGFALADKGAIEQPHDAFADDHVGLPG